MMVLIVPSMAVEQLTIDMSSCPGEGFYYGLLDCSYDDGWRVQETWIEAGGYNFYLDETGMIQYLDEPVSEQVTLKYIKYWTYFEGPQGTSNWQSHLLTINLLPCASEPICPEFVEAYASTSEFDDSYIEFSAIPRSRLYDGDGNGAWTKQTILWTCDGGEWASQAWSSSLGLPAGAVLEARATNLDAPEILSAYAYL